MVLSVFDKPPDVRRATSDSHASKARHIYAGYLRERLYGTVTLTGLMIAMLLNDMQSARTGFVTILSVTGGLWLAGFFASITAHRVVQDDSLTGRELWHEFVIHRGLMSAAALPLFFFGLAWIGVITVSTALMIGIVLSVFYTAALVAKAARTKQNSLRQAIIITLIQLGIAALIVYIKASQK